MLKCGSLEQTPLSSEIPEKCAKDNVLTASAMLTLFWPELLVKRCSRTFYCGSDFSKDCMYVHCTLVTFSVSSHNSVCIFIFLLPFRKPASSRLQPWLQPANPNKLVTDSSSWWGSLVSHTWKRNSDYRKILDRPCFEMKYLDIYSSVLGAAL